MLKDICMLFLLIATIVYIVVMEDTKVEKGLLDKCLDCLVDKIVDSLNKETTEMKKLKKCIDLAMHKLVFSYGIEYNEIFNVIAHTLVWEIQKPVLDREVSVIETKYDDANLRGEYDRDYDRVFINKLYLDKALSEKNSIKFFNQVLKTCCHEMRHAWQHDAGWDFSKYIQPETCYLRYKWQRCEVDARLFAFLVVHCLMTNKKKERLLRKILMNIEKLY